MALADKDIRKALPPGYRIVIGRRHARLVDPDGNIVRGDDGRPFVIPHGRKVNHKALFLKTKELRKLG